jgi:hypothetical protein
MKKTEGAQWKKRKNRNNMRLTGEEEKKKLEKSRKMTNWRKKKQEAESNAIDKLKEASFQAEKASV